MFFVPVMALIYLYVKFMAGGLHLHTLQIWEIYLISTTSITLFEYCYKYHLI